VISSNRRENNFTLPLEEWHCILKPSYLYSAAASPPIFSSISWGSYNRSANIGLIGRPTVTRNSFKASSPRSARTRATYPKSEHRLYALSNNDRLYFPHPSAIANASNLILFATPDPRL